MKSGRESDLSIAWPELSSESEAAELYGRLAGLLFIVSPLLAIPSALLLTDGPAPFVLVALSIVVGLVTIALPWRRLDARPWFIVLAATAAALVAGAHVTTDGHAAAFYTLVGLFSAYVFRSRVLIASLVVVLIGCSLLPLALGPDDPEHSLAVTLLALPVLVVATSLVTYVRERQEVTQQAYVELILRTVELTLRIRNRPGGEWALTDDDRRELRMLAAQNEALERIRSQWRSAAIRLEPGAAQRLLPKPMRSGSGP